MGVRRRAGCSACRHRPNTRSGASRQTGSCRISPVTNSERAARYCRSSKLERLEASASSQYAVFLAGLVLLMAYGTSRGYMHVDTGLAVKFRVQFTH